MSTYGFLIAGKRHAGSVCYVASAVKWPRIWATLSFWSVGVLGKAANSAERSDGSGDCH